MDNKEQYISMSLELHLFFARIMKEHALFLKAGFTPVDPFFSRQAEVFKREFEKLLEQAVMIANGNISERVINSGEIVTQYTLEAERQTQRFTGIAINQMITMREMRLKSGMNMSPNMELMRSVKMINQKAMQLLDGIIEFKEKILQKVLHCNMFTMNYPLLIEHILREAKMYRSLAEQLEGNEMFGMDTMKEMEMFWNQIMMEHALFIRGLLDPTENELIDASDVFAQDYANLLTMAVDANDRAMLRSQSLEETMKFQEFKTAGTKGIQDCEIRSIILPLLADHVLREANHYIRLLEE